MGYDAGMVTVLQAAGMRFVIHTDDHEPAHVHVYGDGEARIDITEVAAISTRRMSKRDLARALTIVVENRQLLRNRWRELHE